MNDNNFDEKEYDLLCDTINNIFPDSPFIIDNINNIEELDKTFTEKNGIIIMDGRIDKNNYYYSDLTDNEISEYIDYLGISKIDNQPITLRQVLNKMIASQHYNNEIVKNDDHIFLEGFDIKGITYTAFFGS
jgi:hypothetical protein